MLKLSASEADQLEVKFASLASSVSRLPLLRSQVGHAVWGIVLLWSLHTSITIVYR